MRIAVLSLLVLASACKRDEPAPKPKAVAAPKKACSPTYARHLCDGGDAIACGWVRALDRTDFTDEELRTLLPALVGKTFTDDPPATPAPMTYEFEKSPRYVVPLPIDWAADPEHNRSWRSSFQNLSWLYFLNRGSAAELDASAYVVADWARQALAPDAVLEFTWHDASIAKRLDRVSRFLERYVAEREQLNRQVVIAAVRIIATHVDAMAVDACYAEHSNHGMMQDLALLKHARTLPGLETSAAVRAIAVDRLEAHVKASVTGEGIHVENSPEYHVMYLRLVIDALDVFAEVGEPAPVALLEARDQMLAALVYLLQPNLTLPQFGDSANSGPQRVRESVEAARRQGSTSPALDQLEWLLTDGASGTMPSELQHVFTASGYAAFREGWRGAEAITGHFRCGRLSDVHDHADDTSFELYGHGTELVIDTGKYSYDYDRPLVKHQYDARAHNVLIVDGAPFDEDPSGRIVASGDGWVRGEHTGYASRGVSVTRTFTYARPDTFTIVDLATAAAPHDYAQHFHLHPTLSDVQAIDDRTVVARIPGGASVTIKSGEAPVRIDIVRGQNDAAGVQGWYFSGWERSEPAADVIFVYGTRPGPEVAFPVTLTVAGIPGR